MGQKILLEVAKGLIILTTLYAIIVADKYHWLDWTGIVPPREADCLARQNEVGRVYCLEVRRRVLEQRALARPDR